MKEIGLLLLGAILAYLLEFTRPWVRSYFQKSSLSIRERRIETLLKEYQLIKAFGGNPTILGVETLRKMAIGLFQLTVLVIQVGLDVIVLRNFPTSALLNILFSFGIGYLGFTAFRTFNSIADTIQDAISFTKYKEKTIVKLKKLGGNPEDLDKEETARG